MQQHHGQGCGGIGKALSPHLYNYTQLLSSNHGQGVDSFRKTLSQHQRNLPRRLRQHHGHDSVYIGNEVFRYLYILLIHMRIPNM